MIPDYLVKGEGCIYKIRESSVTGAVSLCGIRIADETVKEISIPITLPSGKKIEYIESNIEFEGDIIERVIISNGIVRINSCAFSDVKAREFRWSAGCQRIPDGCFEFNTYVERLTGIDDVVVIGQCAFRESGIKSMTWPRQCAIIPAYCFENSQLETITGLSHVRKINEFAFNGNTHLKALDLSVIPYCELQVSSLCGITTAVSHPYFDREAEIANAYFDFDNI